MSYRNADTGAAGHAGGDADLAIATAVRGRQPVFWINPERPPAARALSGKPIGLPDIEAAAARWRRFGPLLASLFEEVRQTDPPGRVDSALIPLNRLPSALDGPAWLAGTLFAKADHALPVAGSIKARGGLYEVLCVAERIALDHGLVSADRPDLTRLATPEARAVFGRHRILVGSTGNLGFSVGVMARALGFGAEVHMARDAKDWKKRRLRALGVVVVEHAGDYGAALARARAEAGADPAAHFVDDEHSVTLFLGYATAALDLQAQLLAQGRPVDAEHPLFVYLPCGVGGAPGGIAFALKHLFGDAAYCFFVEPVDTPCCLIQFLSGLERSVSVHAWGLGGATEADGLACPRAAQHVTGLLHDLLDGCMTVEDAALFRWLAALQQVEGLKVEPSAAAGLAGPFRHMDGPAGRAWLDRTGLARRLGGATHLVWTTGGRLVPDADYEPLLERGLALLKGVGAAGAGPCESSVPS